MRILHLLNHVRPVGNGIVNVAVDLACLQSRGGHAVGVASGGGGYEDLLLRYGVQCFHLPQRGAGARDLLALPIRYRRILGDFRPEIVHAHMVGGVLLASVFRGWGRYALVAHAHRDFDRKSQLMSAADGIIAVSHAVARSLARRGFDRRKLHVVLNGTLGSPRTVPPSESGPADLLQPAIVSVAGMYRRKGIGELLLAFDRIAGAHPWANLYLVGDGPDRRSFQALARRLGSAHRIHFEGLCAEPQRYMMAASIFVLASHREPCALVLCEALTAGCAIVASNVDGNPELLEQGRAGILVQPGDVGALAAALDRLLGDARLRAQLSQAAQERAGYLEVSRVVREVCSAYAAVLQRHRARRPCPQSAGAGGCGRRRRGVE